MADYLYEYHLGYSSVKARINTIAAQFGVTTSHGQNPNGQINSSIKLKDALYESILAEFPGNCSTLVLFNIQGVFSQNSKDGDDPFNKFVKSSIAISDDLNYAMLMVTTTDKHLTKFLEEKYGFVALIPPVVNPHSGRQNYFMVRYKAKDEVQPPES